MAWVATGWAGVAGKSKTPDGPPRPGSSTVSSGALPGIGRNVPVLTAAILAGQCPAGRRSVDMPVPSQSTVDPVKGWTGEAQAGLPGKCMLWNLFTASPFHPLRSDNRHNAAHSHGGMWHLPQMRKYFREGGVVVGRENEPRGSAGQSNSSGSSPRTSCTMWARRAWSRIYKASRSWRMTPAFARSLISRVTASR